MSVFAEYATSTALSISVSVPQIRMMWMLHTRSQKYYHHGWSLMTLTALVRKGLVIDSGRTDRNPKWVLTEPGEHVLHLCELAGLVTDQIKAAA